MISLQCQKIHLETAHTFEDDPCFEHVYKIILIPTKYSKNIIMRKITLTSGEIKFIKEHISNIRNGLFVSYTGKITELIGKLITKASALEEELNASDEISQYPRCDLIFWYYDKYREQSGQPMIFKQPDRHIIGDDEWCR